jgi:NAD(P)-dependent dehydrogenase (short-subunit alcohol dehydrogenase family)
MTQTDLIPKRLDGKIAVITGGNSGTGLSTAQRFVQEGAYVFITGRRQSELDKAVKQIGKNVTGVQSAIVDNRHFSYGRVCCTNPLCRVKPIYFVSEDC